MTDQQDKTDHFYELLDEFDSAMLVTRTREGSLRSRPMNIARSERDGTLWFATSVESGKIDDLITDEHANVSMQSSFKYLSLTGRAQVVRDRATIEELFEESWKVWFPEGKDDPRLCLIKIDARYGEYWDLQGTKALKFLFKAGKAYLTSEPLNYQSHDPDKHGSVALGE